MNSPFRQSEVFNLGICGARTGDIIRRELPEALSLGGEVFLLLAGTNDMLGDAGHGVSPEEYESNMRYLISALSAAGRGMVQLSVCDVHRIFSRFDLDSFDSPLRNPANSGAVDSVHPTAEGYRMMARALYRRFQEFDWHPRRVVCLGDSITCGAYMEGQGSATGETYPAFLKQLLDGDAPAAVHFASQD